MLATVSEREMRKVEGGILPLLIGIGFVVLAGGLLYAGYQLGSYMAGKLAGSSVCK